jgi:hypothetical protein
LGLRYRDGRDVVILHNLSRRAVDEGLPGGAWCEVFPAGGRRHADVAHLDPYTTLWLTNADS